MHVPISEEERLAEEQRVQEAAAFDEETNKMQKELDDLH
eukprot:CAMPEP_0202959966 /NCGR_PEP_ID=MMETSP1396-20130829/4160_1 /ASSEMBLY_ACC=CAM_ASM_000872 /TAXON_ID= /ORGANISM="Pseudokeronopsis sp., Strain Brazil" /LENGTH=38 /DNA_ID= /DNA_START= /DNA_END= /DNA_ORIENTATION=